MLNGEMNDDMTTWRHDDNDAEEVVVVLVLEFVCRPDQWSFFFFFSFFFNLNEYI